MDWSYLNKLVFDTIQGGMFQYILIENGYRYGSSCYNTFFYKFFLLIPWRVTYVIQFPLNDLGPTLVGHLSHYLSACPIGRPFRPSVSWDNQCSTIQGSSLHKCSQKVSYRAFNTVPAAFSQIFLGSHSSSAFVMHAFIRGVSWNVTLSDSICI